MSIGFASGVIFTYVVHPHLSESAGALYTDESHKLALNLISGKGFVRDDGAPDFLRNPLHPFVVAGIYWLFGTQLWIVQLSNILFHTLTVLLVFIIGKRVFGESVGFYTALLTAVHPYLLWFLPTVMLRSLFVFLVACLMLVLVELFERPQWRNGLIVGSVLGLANLAHAEMVLFPLPLLAVLLWVFWRERRNEILKSCLLLVLSTFLVMSPWIVRNYVLTKRFIPGTLLGGYMFLYGNWAVEHDVRFFPQRSFSEVSRAFWSEMRERRFLATGKSRFEWEGASERNDFADASRTENKVSDLEWELSLQQEALQSILADPLRFVRKVLWQIPRFWYMADRGTGDTKMLLLYIGQTFFLLPALAGIFLSVKEKMTKALPVVLLICYFVGVYATIFAMAPYSTPILPYVIMFAVYGFSSILQKCTRAKDTLFV